MRALLDINALIALHDQNHLHHAHIHNQSQITDLYLLAPAVKNGGRLVSFDQRIPLSAVLGALPAHSFTLWRKFKPNRPCRPWIVREQLPNQ